MNNDICLKVSGGTFNYRVGAIIQHDSKLLMVKNSGDTFYYTIGGRVKFGEAAQDTILREALEETGLPLEIERLAFIHENFFAFNPESEPCHEVCLFFLMKPHEKLVEIRQTFEEAYGEVSIHWLPIDNLDKYEVYPEFFRTALTSHQANVRHFVTRNDITSEVTN